MRNLVIDRIRALILESYVKLELIDKLEQMSNVELLDLYSEFCSSEY